MPGPEARDVPRGVDESSAQTLISKRFERALSGPTLHKSGRIDASRHRPRIEPAFRHAPSGATLLQDVDNHGRSFSNRSSPSRSRDIGL